MEKLDKQKENNSNENKKEKEEKQTLSEEEQELSKNIEDMVNGLLDHDIEIKRNAYNLLKKEITTSTGSMTSIPKPLKFCRLHFERVKEEYIKEKTNNPDSEAQKLLGDFLCILVLVTDTKDTSLQYILENNLTNFVEWGQELVRSLSGEISTEYNSRLDQNKPSDDLVKLVSMAVNSLILTHNENEAIDLLIELDLVDDIRNYCNESNYKKFCSYILAMSNYAAESTEQKKLLEIVFELYTKYNELANALRVAIKLKEKMYITSTLLACKNKSTKVQMAFILARSNYYVETTEIEPEISDIMKNLKSSEIFRNLTRALDITAPKHPEEIFKSHLEDKKEGAGAQLESYKINMSTSLVSGFINAGFGKEKLLSEKDNLGNDWLSKNKDEGLLCALASLGLVNIWDIECGPNEIEKFMDVNENNPFKRGGYNLGLGIISSGVVDENNTALALLSEQTKDKK
jgi:26S proteasome regulatory subunit N1